MPITIDSPDPAVTIPNNTDLDVLFTPFGGTRVSVYFNVGGGGDAYQGTVDADDGVQRDYDVGDFYADTTVVVTLALGEADDFSDTVSETYTFSDEAPPPAATIFRRTPGNARIGSRSPR